MSSSHLSQSFQLSWKLQATHLQDELPYDTDQDITRVHGEHRLILEGLTFEVLKTLRAKQRAALPHGKILKELNGNASYDDVKISLACLLNVN